MGFSGGSDGKESAWNAGNPGPIPGSGRSPGGGHDNPTPVFWPGESPWTEEHGRLQSMGSQRVGHDWVTKHSTHAYQNQPISHSSCIHVLQFKLERNFFSRVWSSIEVQLLITLVRKSCKTTLPLMKEITTGKMLLGRGKKYSFWVEGVHHCIWAWQTGGR